MQDDGLVDAVPVDIVEGKGGAVAAALGVLQLDLLLLLLPEGLFQLVLLLREPGGVQEVLHANGDGGAGGKGKEAEGEGGKTRGHKREPPFRQKDT